MAVKLTIFLTLLIPTAASASFYEYYQEAVSYQKELKALATPELRERTQNHIQNFETCMNNTLSSKEVSGFTQPQAYLLLFFFEFYKFQPAYQESLPVYKNYLARLKTIKSSDRDLKRLVLIHRAGYALQAQLSGIDGCRLMREWRYRQFSWQRRPAFWYSFKKKLKRVGRQEKNYRKMFMRALEVSGKKGSELKPLEASSVDGELWIEWFSKLK